MARFAFFVFFCLFFFGGVFWSYGVGCLVFGAYLLHSSMVHTSPTGFGYWVIVLLAALNLGIFGRHCQCILLDVVHDTNVLSLLLAATARSGGRGEICVLATDHEFWAACIYSGDLPL